MFRRGSTLRYKEPKSEVVVVGNLAWGLRSFVNFAKLKERAKEMVVWLRQFCFAKAINFLLIRKRLVTTLKSLLFHPTSFIRYVASVLNAGSSSTPGNRYSDVRSVLNVLATIGIEQIQKSFGLGMIGGWSSISQPFCRFGRTKCSGKSLSGKSKSESTRLSRFGNARTRTYPCSA
jgi:hypothetical protein